MEYTIYIQGRDATGERVRIPVFETPNRDEIYEPYGMLVEMITRLGIKEIERIDVLDHEDNRLKHTDFNGYREEGADV